jgi:prepilin-type N-terminal cleavage/methylation domain-containing protein
MASERAQRLRSRAGYSLIELMTAIGICGVLVASAIPHVDTGRTDLDSTMAQLIGDFRWAQTRSITSGVHHRIQWTGTQTYQVQRMKQNADGSWSVDQVLRRVTLPGQIAATPAVTSYEFNTRGMLVSIAAQSLITLNDPRFGSAARRVAAWPSGQVQPYYG